MESHKSFSSQRKKTPVTFSLTLVQCTACGVILLLALILRLIGGSFFETLRFLFKRAITDTTVTQTISEWFSPAVGGTNLNPEESKDIIISESVSVECVEVQEKAVSPLSQGKITSLFGYRKDPFTNEWGFHSGVDIGAPKGKEILAIYDGYVVLADENTSYGKYLTIQHNNGFQTLYAHCSSLCKKEGDFVAAGEVVAKVGSTGKSTGNHLHLELKQEGIYHNPLEIWKENPYA